MKKFLSVFLASVMTVAVVLSLACCGLLKPKIVGVWEAEVDFGKSFTERIFGSEEEAAKYVNLDGVSLPLRFDFKEDGSFSIYAEDEEVNNFIDALKERIVDALPKFFEDEGLTAEDLDSLGIDAASLIDSIFTQDSVDELKSSLKTTGKYEIDDNKLLTAAEDETFNPEVYMEFKIENDVLTLISSHVPEDSESEDAFSALLPIDLTRVDD